MTDIRFILVAQVASTWGMVGVIRFVQLVHYPLMTRVGSRRFGEYERYHMSRTTWVVVPLMLTELIANLLLLWHPGRLNPNLIGTGLVLLAIIWLSTFVFQVPQHRSLSRGFDESAHRNLVAGNWIRTIAWTARGLWAVWLLHRDLF